MTYDPDVGLPDVVQCARERVLRGEPVVDSEDDLFSDFGEFSEVA